jgi:hypothetical protein
MKGLLRLLRAGQLKRRRKPDRFQLVTIGPEMYEKQAQFCGEYVTVDGGDLNARVREVPFAKCLHDWVHVNRMKSPLIAALSSPLAWKLIAVATPNRAVSCPGRPIASSNLLPVRGSLLRGGHLSARQIVPAKDQSQGRQTGQTNNSLVFGGE